jgi:hypothetical protein
MDKLSYPRLSHYGYVLLAASLSAVFFATLAHHVSTLDFKPLASLCLPVLAVFFTFTSLLYIRGNSLAAGKDQVRTLFAAEHSMQGAVWYLTGIVCGVSVYGLLDLVDATGAWLLLFLAPYALMQVGILLLIRAACIIAPQFLRMPSAYEVWRRIGRTPATA